MYELLPHDQILLVLGMAAVTYLPRVLPLWLLSNKSLHPAFMRFLEMVPPAVLAALLAPSLFLRETDGDRALFISTDNTFLLAAIPAFLVAALTKSFFGTVAAGMGTVAFLRWLM